MGTVFKVGLLVCFWLPLIAKAATTVEIAVQKNGKLQQRGLGSLVANEIVLVPQLLLAQGDHYQVSDMRSGATFVAELVASDKDRDLALLAVKGLRGDAHSLALETPQVGRKLTLHLANQVRREALLQAMLPADKDFSAERLLHTAPVSEGEFGAPVLNNCNEFVGISHNPKQSGFGLKLQTSPGPSAATNLAEVLHFLKSNSVSFVQSQTRCLSEEEKLANLITEKNLQIAEVKKANLEKQQKQNAIEKLQKEKAEQEKALETAKLEAEARQHELEQADLVRQEQEAELKRVADEKAQHEQKMLELQNRQEQEESERQAKRKKQTKLFGALALVVLLALGILLVLIIKKRKQLKEVTESRTFKERELAAEKARLEELKEELVHATASFSDILFVGRDEEGNEHRFKIIGSVLAQNSQGLIVGRSGQNANFVLAVPGVSREHLRINLVEGEVKITDLQSFNGTAVNKVALIKGQQVSIKHGDEVRIGTVEGRVVFLAVGDNHQ